MSNSKKPFVDFRAIRARIAMEQVLEHYGVLGTMKRSGSRLSGPCPIHNGSNPTQFRVETDKNLWNCFSEYKHGGNVLDFIAKKEDIPIHDAALKACVKRSNYSFGLYQVQQVAGQVFMEKRERRIPWFSSLLAERGRR